MFEGSGAEGGGDAGTSYMAMVSEGNEFFAVELLQPISGSIDGARRRWGGSKKVSVVSV